MTVMDESAPQVRQVRGQALVAKVMDATIAELARVGYENLSIEQVAEVAGVNKTTLYRRWATRRELVRAALSQIADSFPPPPDTGSLQRDLIVQLQTVRDLMQRPGILGLMRMMCGGVLHDDIAQFAESIREQKEEESQLVYRRAIARGELPADTDIHLLNAVAGGAIQNLIVFLHESCDDRRLEQLVALLLHGACRGASRVSG